MDKAKYVEIIKKGKRVDWYGVEVPKDLLTNLVPRPPTIPRVVDIDGTGSVAGTYIDGR